MNVSSYSAVLEMSGYTINKKGPICVYIIWMAEGKVWAGVVPKRKDDWKGNYSFRNLILVFGSCLFNICFKRDNFG